MAIEENSGNMVMPVAPMMGNGNSGMGFGTGQDWAWILLLLVLFGGWGNNGYGNANSGGMGGLYPWMNQANQMSEGFQNQMLATQIGSISDKICGGFSDVQLGLAGVNQGIAGAAAGIQNSLCSGFAGTTAAITGAQNALTQQMYANQLADLERSFAAQTANMQGMNTLQAQLANCCCENRAATADLKYTVATENCADRSAAAENTRDIIEAQTRNTQAILDKLCALELDGVKGQLAQAQRENVGLQNQLNMQAMQASQAAQTAAFQQGLNNEVDALYNRLANCPVGTVPVFGNQPIFQCGNNVGVGGCGCGCGA